MQSAPSTGDITVLAFACVWHQNVCLLALGHLQTVAPSVKLALTKPPLLPERSAQRLPALVNGRLRRCAAMATPRTAATSQTSSIVLFKSLLSLQPLQFLSIHVSQANLPVLGCDLGSGPSDSSTLPSCGHVQSTCLAALFESCCTTPSTHIQIVILDSCDTEFSGRKKSCIFEWRCSVYALLETSDCLGLNIQAHWMQWCVALAQEVEDQMIELA